MRMYWIEPDIYEIEVEVKAIDGCKVVVNPLIFHPNEGGQPADKGTIGPATVGSVEIRDGRIIHTLDRPLSDGTYLARVDKEHRLYTARQHTAQHILSGIANKRFGLKTTGVHIGLDNCTVDFDKRIDWDTATTLEQQSMDVIMQNIQVETVFNDTDVRVRSDLKDNISDVIRVVRIGDYDKSACCGAHLKTTGQIGMIRVLGLENKKEGTRVSFLAGRKALEYAQTEASVLRELRKTAGCATSEMPATFEKALNQSTELAKEVNRLWTLLLPGYVETAKIIEIEGEKIGVHLSEVPQKFLVKLAAMIAQSIQGTGIAISGMNIALCSDCVSAKDIFDRIMKFAGGKGGGSPKAANGRLDREISFNEVMVALKSNVHKQD